MAGSRSSTSRVLALAVATAVLVLLAAGFAFLILGPVEIPSSVVELLGLEDDSRNRALPERSVSLGVEPPPVMDVNDTPVTMIDITTDPRIVTFDNPGESVQLTIQGYYSDGTVGELAAIPGAEPSFISADPEVALVSADGVVTGIEAGGVGVEVAYGGFTTEVPILVFEPFVPLPAIDPERVIPVAEDGTAIVLNQLMVELQPDVSESETEAIAASIGGRIVYRFESFPGIVVENEARTEVELNGVLALLEEDPRVTLAYPDVLFEPSQGPTPTGIETLDNFPGVSAYTISRMDKAWELMNNADLSLDPVVNAVIDTAFPIDDEERIEYYLLNEEFDTKRIRVENMRKVVTNLLPADSHHGVAVTSVIAAKNNSPNLGGISGVIPSVNGLPYHVLFFEVGELVFPIDDTLRKVSEISVLVAQDHIGKLERGIDVVNISMARSGQKLNWRKPMQSDSDITYVVAAGNEGDDIRKNYSPASFTLDGTFQDSNWWPENWPALDNVITVAGTQSWDDGERSINRHPGSNFGEAVTLGAPYEVQVLDTKTGGISELPGTSYSTPLVTGTAALLKSITPNLSPSEIRYVLTSTGRDVSTLEGNILHWKALDAGAAVKCVLDSYPRVPENCKPSPSTQPIPTSTPKPNPFIDPIGPPVPLEFPTPTPTLQPEPPHATATQVPVQGRSNQPPGSTVWVKEIELRTPSLPALPQGSSYAMPNSPKSTAMWESRLDLYRASDELYFDFVDTRGASFLFRTIDVNQAYGRGGEMQSAGAMEASTGTPLWRFDIEGLIVTTPNNTVDGQSGIRFETVGGSNGRAVHPGTGNVLWNFPPGDLVRVRGVVDGIAYIDSDSSLLAIDAVTGERYWQYDFEPIGHEIWFDRGVLYLATERGLTALETGTGSQLWHYEHDSSLRISTIENRVVYAGNDNTVIAIDATTGRELWWYERSDRLFEGSPVRIAGKTVFLWSGARDSVVYAIDGAKGEKLWEYGDLGTEARVMTVEDGVAYLKLTRDIDSTSGSSNWRLAVVAVDAITGQPLWRLQNNGVSVYSVEGKTALVDVIEGIDRYFERYLYAVNRDKRDGDWRYKPPFDLPNPEGRFVALTSEDVSYVTAFKQVKPVPGQCIWD